MYADDRLPDFTVDRPYSLRERRARSHDCLAITIDVVRCGRCGLIKTDVESIIGPSSYRPEHRAQIAILVRQAWDDHVAAADAADAVADREYANADVAKALTKLRAADPDPLVAAVMVMTGMTRAEIDDLGGLPDA